MRARATIALVLLGIVLAAPAPVASAKGNAGQIIDFEIQPPKLTVTAGDTITWTNGGKRPHTVTDRGGLFDTDSILPGAQGSVTVDVPGTYEVFCKINPSKMNAKLVVLPGPTPPNAFRVEAFDEARTGETKRFEPQRVEVAAGTRIVMANVGGLRHSLAAEDGSFKTPVVEPGAEVGRFAGSSASVVVTKPGTYAFFCEIHPAAMRGTIVVTSSAVETPLPEAAPPPVERPPLRATATASDFTFAETETLVAPGGTVVWTNRGTKPHTATFDDTGLDTGRMEPGASAELTAPGQPGTYSYYCAVHPDRMRAVVVVSSEPAATQGAAAVAASGDSEGTVFAYAIAALVIGTGVVGVALAARRS